MEYRYATTDDAPLLARLNQQLIRDEGHRNRMTLQELETRMIGWLGSEYQAVLFECGDETVGFALFRYEPEHVYLRQFFVKPEFRREGIGRSAIEWLRRNVWGETRRIRLDVLVGNEAGIAFWKSLGFKDYCITLEMGDESVH